jgi:hypothetical protein
MFVQGVWIADGVARVTIDEYGQRHSRFPHDRLAGSLGSPRIEACARLPDSLKAAGALASRPGVCLCQADSAVAPAV